MLFFDDLDALRAWLPGADGEAWIGFPRVRYGKAVPSLRYDEVAAELATVGWVQAGRQDVDRDSYAVLFAPGTVKARKAPAWATDEGPHPEPELNREQEERFRADAEAWAFFEAQPPRYRRAATWWVVSGKSEETRERRLGALIEASAAGERLPQLVRNL